MAVVAPAGPLQNILNAQKNPGGPPSYPPPEVPLRAVQDAANYPLKSEVAAMATEQESRSLSSRNRSQSSLASRLVPPTPGFMHQPALKSQYPAESKENHVEYILVASFDIDRGSVMEHQYPGPISGDETMLAELMLPDQAHVRSQDWTIFFLHKDTTAEEEAREERRERRRKRRRKKEREANGEVSNGHQNGEDGEDDWEDIGDEDTDEEDIEPEGPPLIYVLNLVNTKQDQTAKRGAICKAMAICTRHSFLHIYKPLLLLALEEYFRAPLLETLASLYNAVNSMDLSLMPRLTPLERTILQTSDAKDMFIEKFSIMIQQRMALDEQRSSQGSKNSQHSSPSRGPGNKYALPRDTHEFESRVQYNAVPVPIKVPVAITPETVGDFSLIKLITTFSVPHSTSPQPFSPLHPHLTTSGACTHPIMVLINALLTQKRIIFLGHNQPSGSVAEAVLAACFLASGGILKGFTRHAFPYTDLTKIDDLLKVPGFIAGVTNPAFANKPEWWDLLCDLPSGRMTISKKMEMPAITEGYVYFQQNGLPGFFVHGMPGPLGGHGTKHSDKSNGIVNGVHVDDPSGDAPFMENVMQCIANRLGETAVRTKFRGWVQHFSRVTAAFEELVFGASALNIGAAETDADVYGYGVSGHGLVWPDERERLREIQANVGRIEGWRVSRSYFSLIGDLARTWEKGDVLRGLDLGFQIEKLRGLRTGDQGAGDIYLAIDRAIQRAGLREGDPDFDGEIDEEEELLELPEERDERLARRAKAKYDVVNQLLAVMPESQGGLFHLSLGLFHRDVQVRAAVVRILEAVMEHEAGRHFWASLGRFAKLAFFRVKREMEGRGLP